MGTQTQEEEIGHDVDLKPKELMKRTENSKTWLPKVLESTRSKNQMGK
jgi:hypothetical protein